MKKIFFLCPFREQNIPWYFTFYLDLLELKRSFSNKFWLDPKLYKNQNTRSLCSKIVLNFLWRTALAAMFNTTVCSFSFQNVFFKINKFLNCNPITIRLFIIRRVLHLALQYYKQTSISTLFEPILEMITLMTDKYRLPPLHPGRLNSKLRHVHEYCTSRIYRCVYRTLTDRQSDGRSN